MVCSRLRAWAGAAARPGWGQAAGAAASLAATLAAVALIAWTGWAVYEGMEDSREASHRVTHTHDVLQNIAIARESYAAYDAADKAHALTRSAALLGDRDRAEDQLMRALTALARLAADDEPQAALVRQFTDIARRRIAVGDADGPDDPRATFAFDNRGVFRMTALLEHEEFQLLAQRQHEEDQRRFALRRRLAAALASAVLLVASASAATFYQRGRRLRAERRITDLVGHLPLTVWEMSRTPQGRRRLTYVGPNAARERGIGPALGPQAAEAVIDSMAPEHREAALAALDESFTQRRDLDISYRMVTADGSERWIRSAARARPQADGSVILTGYWADQTAQKRLEGELQALNRELEAFSYSVSHDLRSPLGQIEGFSLALLEKEGAQLSPKGRHYLDRIRGGAQHMSDIVDGLLALANLARGEIEAAPVDMSALALHVLGELQAAEPQRRVDAEIAPGLAAQGDRRLLRQVLANLVGNAWKFTGRCDTACIRVTREAAPEGWVTLRVEDNGVGFDMQHARHLFAPFRRMHSQKDFPGSGIGLATVKRIVDRHGGRIAIDSAPGQGTRVTVTLRAARGA